MKIKNIRFPEKMLQKLSKAAMEQDRSVSWLVRKFVDEGLEKREKNKQRRVEWANEGY
jgi:metal-responsive CopG/Arc/MetJ family transcriptional regulator